MELFHYFTAKSQTHNLLLHSSYHSLIIVHVIVFSLSFDFPPHILPTLNLFGICVEWNGDLGKVGQLWAKSNGL